MSNKIPNQHNLDKQPINNHVKKCDYFINMCEAKIKQTQKKWTPQRYLTSPEISLEADFPRHTHKDDHLILKPIPSKRIRLPKIHPGYPLRQQLLEKRHRPNQQIVDKSSQAKLLARKSKQR